MALPVMSFASGATNSMRGAAFLSGLADAMVVDVGGTSSDVGTLRRGFPREANSVVEIGEVRTLFRMPDLYSIGLGGGSVVRRDPLTSGTGQRRVPPASRRARVRRRDADRHRYGGCRRHRRNRRQSRVADIPAALAGAVLDLAREKLEDAIDRMKTEAGEVPLIAVGGGAFLVPDKLAGVSEVVRVTHGDCANAVGAAIAQISGETDQIYRDMTRQDAIAAAEAQAVERAVAVRGGPRQPANDRNRGHPRRLSARERAPRARPRRRRDPFAGLIRPFTTRPGSAPGTARAEP